MKAAIEVSRNNDPTLLAPFKKFRPIVHSGEGTCANIKQLVDPYTFSEPGSYERTLSGVTNAPMVLSRLLAAFEGLKIESLGQDGYKTTWQTVIEHIETGHIVTFYDYKGGISFGSDVYGDDASELFVNDLRSIIQALKSDRFPHPYDGCVVGETA